MAEQVTPTENQEPRYEEIESLPRYTATEQPPDYANNTLPNIPRYHENSGVWRDPTPLELLQEIATLNEIIPEAVKLPILATLGPEDGPLEKDDENIIERKRAGRVLRARIIELFFQSLNRNVPDVVGQFLALGLVTYDTCTSSGEIPLAAAALSGIAPNVQLLLNAGANPDAFSWSSRAPLRPGGRIKLSDREQRTPLQIAAANGKLSVVCMLMEAKANDAIISPDGAIALRLAASHGHRDIVEYLPARRGGEWLRFRSQHAKSMRKIKTAFKGIYVFFQVFLWEVPKFFVWSIPKHTAIAIKKNYKKWAHNVWDKTRRLGKATAKAIATFPHQLVRIIKASPHAFKEIGLGLWHFFKTSVWGFLKSIPSAALLVVKWFYNGAKAVAMSVVDVFARILSLIHTCAEAVVGFFRNVTLNDIRNGFVAVLHSIFVTVPKTLAMWIFKFFDVLHQVLKKSLGLLGSMVYWTGVALWWIVSYVPKKLWKATRAMGSSLTSGWREVWVWINPKA